MNDARPGRWDEPDELHDERLSELYRAARNVEPPAWLDQRILTAAQTAVEKLPPTPATPWFRWSFRFWAAPVALAATVVLTVGLLRWLPPTSELGGMPAAVEEKASRSLARPTVELDAVRSKDAESVAAPPAPPSPAALPPANPNEQQLIRSRTMPMEPGRSESLQAAPAERRQAGEEAAPVQERTDHHSPVEWRAEIAELRRQGRNAEAAARLAEFRRQYPDEPLNDAEPPQ